MTRIAVLLSVVLLLAAASCGDGDGDQPAPTSTLPAAQPTATVEGVEPTATAATTPFVGSREPVEKPVGDITDTPHLVDVRTGMHEGFERIVFEFDAADPGFRVEYIEEAITCGSGEVLDVDGSAILQVRISPAAAHDDAGAPTFPQQDLRPSFASILEAIQTCDFEGVVTW
ncbi:MAG: hypothetical protein WD939_04075, partial [Dehalococcoidia bacterium]